MNWVAEREARTARPPTSPVNTTYYRTDGKGGPDYPYAPNRVFRSKSALRDRSIFREEIAHLLGQAHNIPYINVIIRCEQWDVIVEYEDEWYDTELVTPLIFVMNWTDGATVEMATAAGRDILALVEEKYKVKNAVVVLRGRALGFLCTAGRHTTTAQEGQEPKEETSRVRASGSLAMNEAEEK